MCFDTRPLSMWMGDVEKDGKTFPRFRKITDPDTHAVLARICRVLYPHDGAQGAPLTDDQSTGAKGQALYARHGSALEAQYSDGAWYVIFNVEKGAWLVGRSHRECMDEYQKAYGDAPSYMRGIGFLDHA